MKNIDDMRVGDFLYLIDCMQEECCEHKRCFECKYYEYCDIDISTIDSMSIREAVEGYAEANCLLDRMNYVNDQKWISVSERLPENNEEVLIQFSNGKIDTGYRVSIFWFPNNEFYADYRVVSWMPLPEPYKGE